MKHAWFIAGTDTEIGKTFTACALLHAARARGFSAIGMKPVAAGTEADGSNEDVEQLRAASSPAISLALPREAVNPYLFQAPIAPHIAAAEEGMEVDFGHINAAYRNLAARAEVVVVEGVGGFRVPLGPALDSADLAVELGLPVILVVGMKLGCINHALLTAQAIRASGCTLAGWVANRVVPAQLAFEDNLATLVRALGEPLLSLPYEAPSA